MLNDKCILHLWTLWGHDKYVSVMSNVFRQCAAVVYVYNTHNLDSFMEVKSLNTTVEKYAPQAPRLLVPRSESETAPLVTQDTAQQWAKANNISFCGTSSGGAIMDSIDRMLATAPIKGKKHDFVTVNFTEFTDCKFCGGFIWGLVKQGQSCRACKYPVHHKCAKRAEEETSCL
ncbi:hypothetical protein Pelo_19233 [Pelomyxa schiedti]|nr:hypothetical protein Pelo_19233 [Pelomyxa schiedti]